MKHTFTAAVLAGMLGACAVAEDPSSSPAPTEDASVQNTHDPTLERTLCDIEDFDLPCEPYKWYAELPRPYCPAVAVGQISSFQGYIAVADPNSMSAAERRAVVNIGGAFDSRCHGASGTYTLAGDTWTLWQTNTVVIGNRENNRLIRGIFSEEEYAQAPNLIILGARYTTRHGPRTVFVLAAKDDASFSDIGTFVAPVIQSHIP